MKSNYKKSMIFFIELEKAIVKLIWNQTKKKTEKYYKAIVIKTAWCSHKNRNIVQSDTIEHRSKPTYLEPKDFQQRYKENTLEKRQPSH
jgi:hypothetical protein